MTPETEQLIGEIEAAAEELGIAPSTIGQRVGQGGRFYARLKAGKRVWPETVVTVRERLRGLRRPADGDAA